MHNIKDIRKNPNLFKNQLNNRFAEIDLEKIIFLDENNRNLIPKKETLEKEKKDISKKKDSSLFERSKKISEQISKFVKQQSSVKNTGVKLKPPYFCLRFAHRGLLVTGEPSATLRARTSERSRGLISGDRSEVDLEVVRSDLE